jgi:hypothetical protein
MSDINQLSAIDINDMSDTEMLCVMPKNCAEINRNNKN